MDSYWFKYESFDGDKLYLDKNGQATMEPLAWPGDKVSARIECSRRAALWEQHTGGLMVLESLEVVSVDLAIKKE